MKLENGNVIAVMGSIWRLPTPIFGTITSITRIDGVYFVNVNEYGKDYTLHSDDMKTFQLDGKDVIVTTIIGYVIHFLIMSILVGVLAHWIFL